MKSVHLIDLIWKGPAQGNHLTQFHKSLPSRHIVSALVNATDASAKSGISQNTLISARSKKLTFLRTISIFIVLYKI